MPSTNPPDKDSTDQQSFDNRTKQYKEASSAIEILYDTISEEGESSDQSVDATDLAADEISKSKSKGVNKSSDEK